MKKIIALVMLLIMAVSLEAKEVVGVIASLHGIVKVKDGIKKKRVKKNTQLFEGNLVTTSEGASAVLKLNDGSKVVLDEKSSLNFPAKNSIKQAGGAVYYEIASRDATNHLKVATDFAIIGIKGTKFIVNAASSKNVLLDEGKVGIENPKGEYALYKEKEMSEYEKYKAKTDKEFAAYKAKQEKEFVAFVKEFDLQAGHMVSFDGNRAEDASMSKKSKEEFAKFRALLQSEK